MPHQTLPWHLVPPTLLGLGWEPVPLGRDHQLSDGPGPSCRTPGLSIPERPCYPAQSLASGWSIWGMWTAHTSRLDKQLPPAPAWTAGVGGQPDGHRRPWSGSAVGPAPSPWASAAWGHPTPTPPPAPKAPAPAPQTRRRSAPHRRPCGPHPAPWSAATPASRGQSHWAALAEPDAAHPPVPSGLSDAPPGVPRTPPTRDHRLQEQSPLVTLQS